MQKVCDVSRNITFVMITDGVYASLGGELLHPWVSNFTTI